MSQRRRKKRGRISAVREFGLLLKQYWMILIGAKKNLIVMLAFPVIAAFITIWIAGKDMFVSYEATKSGCFVIVCAAIWGGLFNSIQTVVKERAMVKRDIVSGGMRIYCYTASRALLQLLLCVFQSAILSMAFPIIAWHYSNDDTTVELPAGGAIFTNHSLLEIFLGILLLMYAADTLGFVISCFVKKADTASVLSPYILIVELILAGFMFKLEGVADKISYLMISRWGIEALGTSCNALSYKSKADVMGQYADAKAYLEYMAGSDDSYNIELNMFEFTKEHLTRVWLVLLVFSIVCILVANFALHKVKNDTRE